MQGNKIGNRGRKQPRSTMLREKERKKERKNERDVDLNAKTGNKKKSLSLKTQGQRS